MQFPADKVRIDVIGREHLIGLGREDELVRVVRHVQFLFADQLEIVALERTIEDERIVKRRRTGGTRIGRVEGKAWRQLHAALTGQILPGTSPGIRVAQRIDNQELDRKSTRLNSSP